MCHFLAIETDCFVFIEAKPHCNKTFKKAVSHNVHSKCKEGKRFNGTGKGN